MTAGHESSPSREAIMLAARRLFVERGYRGISMREIADEVGMTKAALYYHFRDKEELFLAILNDVLGELSGVIEESSASGGTSRQQVESIVQQIMLLPAERRASLRLASQELSNLDAVTRQHFVEQYHSRFIGRITNILTEGVARGELKSLDPVIATWSLLGMMYPYFHVSPATGLAPTPTLVSQLLLIFFEGLQGAL